MQDEPKLEKILEFEYFYKQNNHNGYAAFCLPSPASNGHHVGLHELTITPIPSANRCQNSAIYGMGVVEPKKRIKAARNQKTKDFLFREKIGNPFFVAKTLQMAVKR